MRKRSGLSMSLLAGRSLRRSRRLSCRSRRLSRATNGRLITDGERGSFTGDTVTLTPDRKLTVTLKPSGGFVLVLPVQ